MGQADDGQKWKGRFFAFPLPLAWRGSPSRACRGELETANATAGKGLVIPILSHHGDQLQPATSVTFCGALELPPYELLKHFELFPGFSRQLVWLV